jgi:UDP-N-acetylmuramate dehydrogenase
MAAPTVREEFDAPLARLTTMRVGGPAQRLVTVSTTDELVDAVREVDEAGEPLLVLGGGSNVVVSDEGFAGTVVRVATRGVQVESADLCGGALVRVAAGEPWEDLVALAVQNGWAGIEALAGIPGSTGATPIQNVGAYGQEVAQTIATVRTWDRREQRVHTFANSDCGFTYRHSLFKDEPRYVVFEVVFQLAVGTLGMPVAYPALAGALAVDVGARVAAAEVREAVLELRRARGMVLDERDPDTWSCGSFFTNPVLSMQAYAELADRAASRLGHGSPPPPRFDAPDGRVKTSAAWLIDGAGFGTGYGLPGPAALSTKHPLAITNRGSATAADVVARAREVRDGVEAAFGVRLVNEPVLVGLSL